MYERGGLVHSERSLKSLKYLQTNGSHRCLSHSLPVLVVSDTMKSSEAEFIDNKSDILPLSDPEELYNMIIYKHAIHHFGIN